MRYSSKCSNSTESTSATVVVNVCIEFIHTVAVVADANVTSLDIANVAGNFHCGLHAKLVNEGDGLDRVWLLHVEAEYAVNYPTDQLPFTFCVLLTVKIYLAAVLAVQLAEGGPGVGLPLHNLDEAGSFNVFVFFFLLVKTCLLIPLIKCLKGHKSLGSLCRLVKTLIVSLVRPREGQGVLLSCCGQLKTPQNTKFLRLFMSPLSLATFKVV